VTIIPEGASSYDRAGTDAGRVRNDGAGGRSSVADVTERLMGEFEPRIDLSTITRIVRACSCEMPLSNPDAPLGMLEHLARERLLASLPPDPVS